MIFTFYSFKGGVGRSMALANVAEIFYRQGRRVVMVDWDLEAPGLESFFIHSEEELKHARSQLGLIDLLSAYKRQFSNLAPTREKSIGKLLDEKLPALDHSLYRVNKPSGEQKARQAALWLLTAGCREGEQFGSYAETVQSFDWGEFYEDYEGEAFFEWMRRQLESQSDMVLIDSRTGVTEMGGVCTRQLADVVVALCAPNEQNLNGVARMTQSFIRDDVRKARGGKVPEIIVIPARLDSSEIEDRNRFKADFLRTVGELTNERLSQKFWDLGIPYVAKYAYNEMLAVGSADRTEDLKMSVTAEELEDAYRRLAGKLIRMLPPQASASPIHPDIGQLVNRVEEISLFRDFLENRDVFTLIVVGPSGVGKTTLSHRLSQEASDKFWRTVHVDPRNYAELNLEKAIYDELGASADFAQPLVTKGDRAEQFLSKIKDGIGKERIVIFIDNVERFSAESEQSLARLVAAVDDSHFIKLVLSGQKVPDVMAAEDSRVLRIALSSLSQEDVRKYIELQGIGDLTLIEFIASASQGNPASLASLLEAAKRI